MGFLFNKIRSGFQKVKTTAMMVATVVKHNPRNTIALGALVAPMLVAGPLLAIVGFSAVGPVAGTFYSHWLARLKIHPSLVKVLWLLHGKQAWAPLQLAVCLPSSKVQQWVAQVPQL
jgi:hypothetical protein